MSRPPAPPPSHPSAIELTGPAVAGEPEAVRLARVFLEDAAAMVEPLVGKLPPAVAEALVAVLVERGEAGRLEQLAGSTDKALAKQARRGIHLLRSRGVRAEVPAPTAGAPAWSQRVTGPEPELESLVTLPYRDGETLIWYVRPSEDQGAAGLEVCQVEASETDGMQKFERYRPTRRQWREIARSLPRESGLEVAPVPSSWARWLVEEAWRRAVDAGRTPPREYAELRHALPTPSAPARHPAEELVSEAAVAAAGPPEAALALPETKTWIPEEEAARRAYLQIEEVATSPLYLDERQRDEQIEHVLRRVAGETLGGPFRARLARRFLDTAYLITRLPSLAPASGGMERDRGVDAARCVAAARHVADEQVAPEDNRVVRALFARLVQRRPAPEPPEPDKSPEKLIISP